MSRFEKWSVWITSALTLATGVGYLITKYLFSASDPYAVVNHPWQPFFLKTHVLVSPLLLFALGVIAVRHVWKHFVTGVRRSRRTALVTSVSVVPMVLTGYLIQVLVDPGWIRSMAIAHIAFGLLYGVGLAIHTWIIRRSTPSGRESTGTEEPGAPPEPAAAAGDPASRPRPRAPSQAPRRVRREHG